MAFISKEIKFANIHTIIFKVPCHFSGFFHQCLHFSGFQGSNAKSRLLKVFQAFPRKWTPCTKQIVHKSTDGNCKFHFLPPPCKTSIHNTILHSNAAILQTSFFHCVKITIAFRFRYNCLITSITHY